MPIDVEAGIQIWNIARFVPYARNPRKNDAAVDRMAASIKEFGFKVPVLARRDGEVVDGHLRLKASRFTSEVLQGLLRIGFLHHQQIIWRKTVAALTRTHHWFAHEPCWYVRKNNAPWFGKPGENTTIWDGASPKMIMGGSDEEKFDHPTQKPVELMRRPILNHTKRGELVYEPFLGSGTTLAAAELTDRVCRGLELDPRCLANVTGVWWLGIFIHQRALGSNS